MPECNVVRVNGPTGEIILFHEGTKIIISLHTNLRCAANRTGGRTKLN